MTILEFSEEFVFAAFLILTFNYSNTRGFQGLPPCFIVLYILVTTPCFSLLGHAYLDPSTLVMGTGGSGVEGQQELYDNSVSFPTPQKRKKETECVTPVIRESLHLPTVWSLHPSTWKAVLVDF